MSADPWEVPPEGGASAVLADLVERVPAVTTARLRLRVPRIGDFAAYAEIVTTERGVHIGGPMSREEAWLDFLQGVAGWLMRGYGTWSVERLEDGRLLGFLILNHEFGDAEPELGFLFRAEAEGQGYAQEAARAARGFAFATLGLASLVSYVAPGNARSARLAERLGARRDAEPFEGMQVYRHSREVRP